MNKRSGKIIALLAGLSLGVLVGILFAPTGGASMRRRLSYQLKRFGRKIYGFIESRCCFNDQEMASNTAKVAGQDLINHTAVRAQKLLDEIKTLSAQLESNL